ncbi:MULTISPECIES: GNAT family N-acetyltransferase [unclassified Synechocystis]|uniref:GNAT family N-acetyltransferase n=1 Tax=unclassified Synechocystis TaxID=2640012 RepID=UPI0003FE189F|nr:MULTISPECIES: GNAT family N-acetyltransferase [unclassified Synechocystis]AIE74544.1 Acetyltransferase [Synechocystis sp. PCC 6714]
MLATLDTRKATTADIPFLARIEYEASLPPLNHCFWEDLLHGTGTTALQFIEAELRANASNWGNVADFLILEDHGKPVAAAAGYVPNKEDYSPLNLSYLEAIAQELEWSQEYMTTFHERYMALLGGNLRPFFLTPQATWIIENVAVLPEARGRGFGKILLRALLEQGRSQGHDFAGIMVINGNDRARRTYESIGFKPYQTFYPDYFSEQFNIDFPGVTKFGLRLN